MDNFHDRDLIHSHVFNTESDFFQKYGITIIHPKGVLIEGLPSGEACTLAFATQYGGNPVAETIRGLPGMGTAANALKTIGGYTGYSANTILDSISKFESHDSVPVSIELFVMKEFSDYGSIITGSLQLSTPDEITGDFLIKAPMRYAPNDKDGKGAVHRGNTCTVKIGDRLIITHLICENFTYTESEQMREDGAPVYLKLNYQFKTGRAMDWGEYRSWFVAF